MPTSKISNRRLIENQELMRSRNEVAQEALDKLFAPVQEAQQENISFFCECSRASCRARLALSLDEYKHEHKRRDRFTIKHGHDIPSIEKVITENDRYIVVQKFALKA